MKQAVVAYIVHSTTVPLQPLNPPFLDPTPNKERKNAPCEGNFLWFVLCSVMNTGSITRRCLGKEPVSFLGRNVGQTRGSGGNQAYCEHSLQ